MIPSICKVFIDPRKPISLPIHTISSFQEMDTFSSTDPSTPRYLEIREELLHLYQGAPTPKRMENPEITQLD